MRTFNVLLFIAFSVNSTFGQAPAEEIKKSIKDYFYRNLHDFKSYEPIEFGEPKQIFTTLEENPKYIEYFNYIEEISLVQKRLEDKISSTRLSERALVELKEELAITEKADYSSLDSLPEEISKINKNNRYLIELHEQLNAIKQGKPIPGKEYLSDKPRGKKEKERQADLVAREIERINREINSETMLPSTRLNKIKFDKIERLKSEIHLHRSLLFSKRGKLPELEKQHLINKENLSKYENNISELKGNFKPEHTGYIIIHRFRAKNALGALINNLKCFVMDKDYNIIDVWDSSCY